MGTTTFSAMRASANGAVRDITPTTRADRLFQLSKEHGDFRAWVEDNPKASFRRFALALVGGPDMPLISNTDVEDAFGAAEFLCGYPKDFRYGDDALRDMRTVMEEDFFAIDNVIGHRGTGTYTDGCMTRQGGYEVEDFEDAVVMSIQYQYYYRRAV